MYFGTLWCFVNELQILRERKVSKIASVFSNNETETQLLPTSCSCTEQKRKYQRRPCLRELPLNSSHLMVERQQNSNHRNLWSLRFSIAFSLARLCFTLVCHLSGLDDTFLFSSRCSRISLNYFLFRKSEKRQPCSLLNKRQKGNGAHWEPFTVYKLWPQNYKSSSGT